MASISAKWTVSLSGFNWGMGDWGASTFYESRKREGVQGP